MIGHAVCAVRVRIPVPSRPVDGLSQCAARASDVAGRTRRASLPVLRQARRVTTGPEDPQPRDIAVEQETAEVEAELEAQSEPESDES